MDLNQTIVADCLKEQTNFGSTTYFNICAHTQTVVPWGAMDYVGALTLCAVGLFVCFMFIGLGLMFWRDR